ncbi:MAG: universal stress protein [Syntrophobacteraceae bacterium]
MAVSKPMPGFACEGGGTPEPDDSIAIWTIIKGMNMKILFPVERFSEVSSILAPFALSMARLFGGDLHVLRVEPPIDQFMELRIKEAEEWLDEFVAKNLACSNITIHKAKVIPGEPAVAILKYIDENEMDGVIIGTHGTKGLSAILFGSVAKEIVGKSPVPVLTINPYKLTESYKKRNAEYLEHRVESIFKKL